VMTLAALLFSVVFLPSFDIPGDGAFTNLDYPTAVREYEAALEAKPGDAQVLWRLSRVYVCMAETAEEPDRTRLLQSAEEFARRSIASDSTLPEAHTWRAAALGYIAFYAGVSDQVRLTWEILTETEKALALNPRDDAAYSIRGSLYRALGGAGWLKRQLAQLFVGKLPPGGYEEGEAALLQAVSLAPDVMRHHYELGVLYLDWGKIPEARRALERAQELPIRVGIDRPRKSKIGELLRKIQDSER
jgi:tetratricopeptide (TPR) repeat protein